MATFIKMPRLGLTMTEGTIVKWFKEEGDRIEKGEKILEIESDKSVVPFESPEEGILLKIIGAEGDVVECQADIAVLGEEGESYDAQDASAEKPAAAEAPTEEAAPAQEAAEAPTTGKPAADEKTGRIFASPRAKRVAAENQVDLSLLRIREGKQRIEEADVLAYIEANKVKMTPLAAKFVKEQGIDPASLSVEQGKRIFSSDLPQSGPAVAEKPAALAGDRRIKVQGMRKVIATRMKGSLDTAAHVTLDIKVDMTEALLLLEKMQPEIMDEYGVKLSLNDIVIKCTARALAENPRINSVYSDAEIIEKQQINVGMAVALQEGLVVPVIKDANLLTLGQVASESKRLAKKAKETGLSPDDMSGGTFTISNLGMYGITRFTSIINQPESAILSVAKVEKQPVVIDDQIEIRSIMNLTLNFDHRPIDGATAAIFLKRLGELLESPWKILA